MAELGYKISFTTGGLLYREAVMATDLYFQLSDWQRVKSEINHENLLRARTQSSLVRTTRELIQRLQILSDDQLRILANGSRQEQNQILWLAVCKQYRFIYEFAVEVVREKFLRLDLEITYSDFDSFFNSKAQWNDDLDQTTETTRKKLRQVLFRMLAEAEIISNSNMILPLFLSPRIAREISQRSPEYFQIFPLSDIEIRNLKAS